MFEGILPMSVSFWRACEDNVVSELWDWDKPLVSPTSALPYWPQMGQDVINIYNFSLYVVKV